MGPRLVHYSDVENAYDEPDRIGRLAGTLRSLSGPDALVCGTGDDTGPGMLSLVTEGRQSLPFFDAVDPAVETFGNHDFDHGLAATRDVVAESPQTWVSANVRTDDGERFLADETVPRTVERVGDLAVGFVGVTDPTTATYNPSTDGLEFTDPLAAVREAATALRADGVDRVAVLSHLGDGDEVLAAETDVDVVLGGHVHSERIERVDGTLLTRPGVNGEVVLTVDLDGTPSVTRHETAEGPMDEDVAAAMRRRRADAGLDEVVARIADPIERTESAVFRGESRIGNFVADAYRWAADADVGLQNSGGIREGPPLAGEVTVGDLVSVVPFEEPVAVARVTGAELREVVHQCSCATLSFGEADWWNGHVSGIEVVYDWTAERIDSLSVGGDPVDDDATYDLATTAYLFQTSAEFPVLEPSHVVETLDVQYEVLADYAREFGVDPRIEERIVYR